MLELFVECLCVYFAGISCVRTGETGVQLSYLVEYYCFCAKGLQGDLGGTATTAEVGDEVVRRMRKSSLGKKGLRVKGML